MAMGSGPHPKVPYGIPSSPPHGSLGVDLANSGPLAEDEISKPTVAYRVTPLFWLISSLVYAGLLVWAFQAIRKK
jgi:hypothetical protein